MENAKGHVRSQQEIWKTQCFEVSSTDGGNLNLNGGNSTLEANDNFMHGTDQEMDKNVLFQPGGGDSAPTSFQSYEFSFSHLVDADDNVSVGSRGSISSDAAGELDEQLVKLRLELKQTMEMYNSACGGELPQNLKEKDIDQLKKDKTKELKDAKLGEEALLALADIERQKCKAAVEAAQKAQRIAEMEIQKRLCAEGKFRHEVEEKKKATIRLLHDELRYRKYSIEEIEAATDYFNLTELIGEGGYGPVYRGYLDYTPVAIKALRPDLSHGQRQFFREVEVLSSMRHPHLVILLGACPEYGCLVYEYCENGSLEDRLFLKGNTPAIPWSRRFKIAAEIATALQFLHQAKPEPLVHRDLKPANILLDKNYVSKIADVGLARLVASTTTTAAAGTFCYIDPEYQQTGKLGKRSDIYSLGMTMLQILTARPPMGLSHHVEYAIENGIFHTLLDPTVNDWPVDEALEFAKLAIWCCQLRRKDRPDLGSVILPLLQRLANLEHTKGPTF